MYRTHTCGELRAADAGREVTLAGWIQRSRDLGGMTFVDLRDRYGITQLVFDMQQDAGLCEEARRLGREYVVQVKGLVRERSSKNKKLPTGDIEIEVKEIRVLSRSELPPFTIEEESDGGEEIRMKYRYLDLRRVPLRDNLLLRHRVAQKIRQYLDGQGFLEIETPALIKSTPEGARDFVVPSRLHERQFYALPQSPQIFKQLLMIAGYDKYFQLVKCFRDEDLRADRQPEFTQVDCEMSFVEQEDVLNVFEGLIKELLSSVVNYKVEGDFPRMTWAEAMRRYGTDKPDIRYDLEIIDITDKEVINNAGFKLFDEAEYIAGLKVESLSNLSRKQLDKLTSFLKQMDLGINGLIYIKGPNEDYKSSLNIFPKEKLIHIRRIFKAKKEEVVFILVGKKIETQLALSRFRLKLIEQFKVKPKKKFAPLWVTEFPLLEWDEEEGRFVAKHHPFTSPLEEDLSLLEKDPAAVRANAYDLVINGVEVGGGSIRIHDTQLQSRMLDLLGFSREAAEQQFGFLLEALRYGTPPHGGIALGFDRLVALLGGGDSIRDYIAFPKNNAARDMMADAPNYISEKQLNELHIRFRE